MVGRGPVSARLVRCLWLAGAVAAVAACGSGSPSSAPTKLKVGTTTGVLVSAFGSAWTTDLSDNLLLRIDSAKPRVSGKAEIGARPYGLATGAGSVWVASQYANTLDRVDPQTLKVEAQIEVGYQTFAATFGAGSVWVSVEGDGAVVRVDPSRNEVVARIDGFVDPNGLVYADHALWVSDLQAGQVVRIDTRTNRITDRIAVPSADWITPGAGALWVSSENNRVYRLDPQTGKVTGSVRVGKNPLASAWVGGELWVPNIDSNAISVIDPATLKVTRTIRAGSAPLGVLSTADAVLVTMSNAGSVWRFDTSG